MNNEMRSIRNALRVNCSDVLNEEGVVEMLSGTNVDFSRLNWRPTTVYICNPGDLAVELSPVSKVLFTMAISGIESGGLRDFRSTQPPTLFIGDEFASFGKFSIWTEAMGRMRGYGCKFWVIVQSLAQLKELYGDAGMNVITDNAGAIQCFGGTGQFTGDAMSKLCGTGTYEGVSKGLDNKSVGFGSSENHSTFGRPVMMPDEIMSLKMPMQIVKVQGKNPCYGSVIDPSLRDFPDYLTFMRWIEAGHPVNTAVQKTRELTAALPKSGAKPANDNGSKGVFGMFKRRA